MNKPTRKERRQLRRLRLPEFTVEFSTGEILQQLDSHAAPRGDRK